MKTLIALLLLTTVAAAQPKSTTVDLFKDGVKTGTLTVHGNRAYLRDLKEELVGIYVVEADGTRNVYDPDGKLVATRPASKGAQ